jgi:hypothetical protein
MRSNLSEVGVPPLFGGPGLFARRIRGGSRIWNSDRFGVRRVEVGLDLEPFETARQSRLNWCWAACIQGAFATRGYRVRQERIVRKIRGALIDSGAVGPEIVAAINGLWTGELGARFQAVAHVLWDCATHVEREDAIPIAAAELSRGNSLIFGLDGHAVLLTAMAYEIWPDGGWALDTLTVRDPWPGVPNRRVLRGESALVSEFLCSVHTSRAPLSY